MVQVDLNYVHHLLEEKVIEGPVLELGAGYNGPTCREIVEGAGLSYFGTDMEPAPNVDFVADFECEGDLEKFQTTTPFASVLLLNVLEHTFDPIRILDNASKLLIPGGCLVVIAPATWQLHNFPMDAWRILPNFFEEYARRRNLELVKRHFEYVGRGPVSSFRNADASYTFPPPCQGGNRYLWGRVIHKLFNTFGRAMHFQNYLGIGCVLRTRRDTTADGLDDPEVTKRQG